MEIIPQRVWRPIFRRGRTKALLGIAAALAAVPTMALGQGWDGPSPHVGFNFGRCLANYNANAADALLQTEPGTAEEASAYEALLPFQGHRCVQVGAITPGGVQLNVPLGLLRGYLAQTRYLRLYPDAAPAPIVQAQPGEIDQQILFARLAQASDRPAEMVRIFSDCVLAARPMEVDALVRTRVGSDAEREAISRIGDSFGPCAWEGQAIQFSREMLRFALADALYRMALGQTNFGAASMAGGG